MRILLAPSPDVFDASAPAATVVDSDPDAPGSSATGSSMAGWMSNLEDAPGPLAQRSAANLNPNTSNQGGKDGQDATAARSGEDKSDAGGGVDGTAAAAAAKAKSDADAIAAEKAAAATTAGGDKGKEAKDPDEDEAEKWPRSSKDWEVFKQRRKEERTKLRGEIAERDQKLKDWESKYSETEQKLNAKPVADPEVTAEIERVKAENKALTDRITELDVSRHPRFETYFGGKIEGEIARAKKIVGEDRAGQVERILKLQDADYRQAQLNDFLTDLEPFAQTRLAVVIDNLEKINEEREGEIKKAGEHKDKLSTERTAQTAKMQGALKQAFEETVKQVQHPEKGFWVFKKLATDKEGAADWNKGVDGRIEQAKQILDSKTLSPQRITQLTLDAIALPVLSRAFSAAQKEWSAEKAKLEEQVKAMKAAQPGGNGSGSKGPTNVGAEPGISTVLKPGETPFDLSRRWAEKTASGWQE